ILLVAALFGFAYCGRLDSQYLPPNQRASSGGASGQYSSQYSGAAGQYTGQAASGNQYSGSSGAAGQYSGPSANQIPILRLDNNPSAGDGSYNYAYETADGISAQEEGSLNNDAQLAQEASLTSLLKKLSLNQLELNRAALERGDYQEGQYNEQPQQQYGAPTAPQYRAPLLHSPVHLPLPIAIALHQLLLDIDHLPHPNNIRAPAAPQQQYGAPAASQYRAPTAAPQQYRAPVAAQQQYSQLLHKVDKEVIDT
ncbi:hypothetical protein NQ314_018288, partial [Rhamnusium bicolor]